jgi:hypothetical protein
MSQCLIPELHPMGDGIAKPWGVIRPQPYPATDAAFFNSPGSYRLTKNRALGS